MWSHVRMIVVCSLGIAVLLSASGCSSAQGDSAMEKRQYAQDMRGKALHELYDERPEARQKIDNAAGYGVFTNIGSKIFFLATGNGFGIVHDNMNGQDTYMKMNELGGGFGIGVKKYQAIFVFNNRYAMDRFVTKGWEFGGDADAAAVSGDTGGEMGVQATSGQLDGLEIYTMTDAGLTLSATATAAKYYRDKELNE